MNTRSILLCVALAAATMQLAPATASAGYGGRQYYSQSWSYQPQRTYYYKTYYYKPTPSYTSYNYHYCIHYPSRPRYVYYYNPHSRNYWGRLDLEGKKGAQYSILKQEDRKSKLEDIPEEAFPKPAAMPAIPDAKDGATIEPIVDVPGDDLPAK